MTRTGTALKRLLLGRPMASGQVHHTLLPKSLALPVFSSDPLSSNAYATQEAMLVLALAGAHAFSYVFPISVAVACLLWIVVTSYRQTVHAYPGGGGAYRVARENLGKYPGLVAAAALLTDYALTVAVSITAGVDAVTSAFPSVAPVKIELATLFVAVVTLANLRGARESGLLFAIPTYGFVASIYVMILTGLVSCLDGCPQAETAGEPLDPQTTLSLALLLRAFAAGTTALTGVEAIADGVSAFRYPQSRNAATTLAMMAALSTSMFLGISWLADHTNVVIHPEAHLEGSRTVVAQVAHAVFSGGPMFYVVQFMSAAILILAANTAYQDFPRLSSILAGDRFMPRQFMNRGDRLVFSNGVLILALVAIALIVIFDANLNSLIQLYLLGVFVSFTLSQSGMVRRSLRLKHGGWRRTVAISGFGAFVTGTVLLVIIYTKFAGGAWMVLVAIPILVWLMNSVRTHYDAVAAQLAHPERRPAERRVGHQHIVVLVPRVDAATARAVGYVRSLRAADVVAVTPDETALPAFGALAPDIPVSLLPGRGIRPLQAFLVGRRSSLHADDFLTVVVPEVLRSRSLLEVVVRPGMHRLKASLLGQEGVQVMDIPLLAGSLLRSEERAQEPQRNHVVVLVAGVHNATLQALEYAETLRPTSITAVNVGLVPEETERLGDLWLRERIPHPLEIEDSPFRDIGRSLLDYVRSYRPDGIRRVVTVVLPEFVVPRRRHQLLHGQTALLVKRHLLFEPGVVVVSVPYHLR